MKKLLLIAAFGITGFANASKYSAPPGERVYTWTSTCGSQHTTTFTGEWSLTEMGSYISGINYSECGVRPNVLMPISADMT